MSKPLKLSFKMYKEQFIRLSYTEWAERIGLFDELVLAPADLSIAFDWDKDSLVKCLHFLSSLENCPKLILQWDILMEQKKFAECLSIFEDLPLSLFDVVKVKDYGAIYYLSEKYPDMTLSLSTEMGHHNLESLASWSHLLPQAPKRVALSPELTFNELQSLVPSLAEQGLESEVLILGRNLLYYSPRKLFQNSDSNQSWFNLDCEESSHNDIPVLSSAKSTLMYSPKVQSLVHEKKRLQQIGIASAIIDLKGVQIRDLESFLKYLSDFKFKDEFAEWEKNLKEQEGLNLYPGFFYHNKTDVLFAKLKNKFLKIEEPLRENWLGVVEDVKKSEYIVVRMQMSAKRIHSKQKINYKTPEGKTGEMEVHWIKGLDFSSQEFLDSEQWGCLPYKKGIVVGSQIFLGD